MPRAVGSRTAQVVTAITVIITTMAELVNMAEVGGMMEVTVAIQVVGATTNSCRLTCA